MPSLRNKIYYCMISSPISINSILLHIKPNVFSSIPFHIMYHRFSPTIYRSCQTPLTIPTCCPFFRTYYTGLNLPILLIIVHNFVHIYRPYLHSAVHFRFLPCLLYIIEMPTIFLTINCMIPFSFPSLTSQCGNII